MPTRVTMIVANDCHADARVLRSASALARAGYTVTVLCTASRRRPAGDEVVDGVTLRRLPVLGLETLAAGALGRLAALRAPRRRPGRAGRDGVPAHPGPQVPGGRRPDGLQGVDRARALAGGSGPAPVRLAARAGLDLLLRLHRPLFVASLWRSAGVALCRDVPDVVHAHDANTLPPARRAVRRTGARLVYDAHELWTHRNRGGRRPVAEVVDRWVERRGVRAADAVVTVSPGIAAWLRDRYHLGAEPVLLRNMPARGGVRGGAATLHGLAALAPGARVVAYVGAVTTSRGLEPLVDALAALPDDVHAVVLGAGAPEYLAGLRRRADGAGVGHRLHLVGTVPHELVSATLADADASLVYVEPVCLSYRFALPNKLFESVQARVPVVANDLPDVRSLVEEHGVGEVFATGDPGGMATALRRVLDHPQRYRQAADAAAALLCWDVEEQRLLDLYAALAPVSAPGAARRSGARWPRRSRS